jgi:predicted protein tyrosine phosphatase
MRILYLENHTVFATQVCSQFLSAHTVSVVPSLAAARSALANHQFDLLIVDYDLDDGKGDEFVRAVRVKLPKINIIASSAHDAGNAALRTAGATAVCGKMEFHRIGRIIENLKRIFVCGFDERDEYRSRQITHVLCVTNPTVHWSKPAWFNGELQELFFGDVISEADAKNWKTTAPTAADVRYALEFLHSAWDVPHSRILITCDYGASRSPALAYVFIADQLGPGREAEALGQVLEIRPDAVPNGQVVRLGDALLGRSGALLRPLRQLHAKLNAGWSSPIQ